MNIFQQTIQEYLKEHHANWKITCPETATRYIIDNETITEETEYLCSLIYIRPDLQRITNPRINAWEPYTTETILQQITEAINYMTTKINLISKRQPPKLDD